MKHLTGKPIFWVFPFLLLGLVLVVLPKSHSGTANALPGFDAKWKLGIMRMQQARIPMEGIQLLAKAARQHPERPEAAFQLGEMATGTGQYERALSWYKMAYANSKGEARVSALLRMSDTWFALNKPDSTAWALNKIFEISTDSVLLRSVKQQLIELKKLSNK